MFTPSVRILFVCTGNICRSPMGERLTRAFLDEALGASAAAVGTSSAGTHAVVGKGMEPSSALVLSGLGGDPSGFSAQQLTGEMIESADLVLTMTRRHRREVLKLAPRAMFRAYTLREAGDLLERVEVAALPPVSRLDERARALVAALGAQRATRRRADREVDDVRDPIGQRPSVHQEVGEQIFASLIPLLQALCDTRAGVRGAGASAALPVPRADAPLPAADPATARIDLAVGAPPAARRRPPLSRRR
jgi:protein-tyrosine phosphatase